MSVALFRLAFRPFFLGGSVFALLAIVLWWALWAGHISWQPFGGPVFWHAHEMLFGFICAIIVGFLLTAAQNWTGVPTVKGFPLAALFLLWATARVLMLIDSVPPAWQMLVDLSFLPLAAALLARPLLRVKQYRNLFFVPLLLLLMLANLAMHLGLWWNKPHWIQLGQYGGIGVVLLVVSVLGGRVIPFFTANATGTNKVSPLLWLEVLSVATLIAAVIAMLLAAVGAGDGFAVPTGAVLVTAGLLQGWRWARWRFWLTGSNPLLWSLHLAYLFVPLGLVAMGLNAWGWFNNLSANVHLLTAGAFGSLIVAMMSRVALGHTGRPLRPATMMTLAYVAVPLAALIRGLGMQFWPSQYTLLFAVSCLTWVFGFGIFAAVYGPILIGPRVDGKDG